MDVDERPVLSFGAYCVDDPAEESYDERDECCEESDREVDITEERFDAPPIEERPAADCFDKPDEKIEQHKRHTDANVTDADAEVYGENNANDSADFCGEAFFFFGFCCLFLAVFSFISLGGLGVSSAAVCCSLSCLL